jgi:toxin ParE1/3/4
MRALAALHQSPDLPDSEPRDEIRPRLRSVHVARKGRQGRHFILYRTADADRIEIVRILHDSMDISRHVPQ